MQCPFCEEFVNPASFKKEVLPEWPYPDRIVAKNEGAMAFPGLGPIVPDSAYILVVPKSCSPSFLVTPRQEREALFDLVEALVANEKLFPYRKALIFEHGGTANNSGCKCIDHGHIHLMSIAGVWAALPSRLSKHHPDEFATIDSLTKPPDSIYLFAGYYEIGKRSFSGQLAIIRGCRQPQFFRALIGEMTGNPWDYRQGNNAATMVANYCLAKR